MSFAPLRPYLSFIDDVCWSCYIDEHKDCDGKAWCFLMGEVVDCACHQEDCWDARVESGNRDHGGDEGGV